MAAVFVLLMMPCLGAGPEDSAPGVVVTGVAFDAEVERHGHGDNWHVTWAHDGRQLALWGDGRGFAPAASPTRNNGVAVLLGGPAGVRGINSASYPFVAEKVQHWYAYAALSVDGVLYHFVSYLEHGSDRIAGAAAPTRFVGVRLVESADGGATWTMGGGRPLAWDAPDDRNMTFWREPGDTFSLLSALQEGRDNALARDGFVYFYAPDGWGPGMRNLMLARVPRGRIRDRSAYEFFVAREDNGGARWSPDVGRRVAVYRFRDGWVGSTLAYSWHPFVVHDAPLGLYLMVASGNGRGGSPTFSSPSCLGVYTAPRPWGPWTEVAWLEAWTGDDPGNRLYEPVIPPAWISHDGKTLYLVYSDCRDGYTTNYKLNLQKMRLLIEPSRR